ncbi:MAG: methyltransferase domain-containing protein [Alphaproteobacteria bacterium]
MERVIRIGNRAVGWARSRWKDLKHEKAGGQDIPPASSETLPPSTAELLELFYRHIKSQPADDYIGVHALRFRHTLVRCGTILRNAGQLLELGGQSIIGSFARDVLGVPMIEYHEDLRFPFKLPDNQFDVVLALEVLEHIKDNPVHDASTGSIAGFNFSGLNNLFAETRRVLKPGGLFIITTPNATSVDVLFKVLSGGHPHMHEPHVRELAPAEVFKLAVDNGLERVRFDTFFAWTVASEEFRRGALTYIKSAGFSAMDRGDDSYFEFRKPS